MGTSPSTSPPLSDIWAALPGIFVGMMIILGAATYPWKWCGRLMRISKSKTSSEGDVEPGNSSEISLTSEERRGLDEANHDAMVPLQQATAFPAHGIRGEVAVEITSSSLPANFGPHPEQGYFDDQSSDTISNNILESPNPSSPSSFPNSEHVDPMVEHLSLPPSYASRLTVNNQESTITNLTSTEDRREGSYNGTINSNETYGSFGIPPTPLPLYESLPNSPLPPSFHSVDNLSQSFEIS